MWRRLTTTSTTLEAGMMQQTLEADGIPVLVRGRYAGVFGGAYQGPVPGGLEVMVPEEELERGRDLLGLEPEPEPEQT